MLGLATHEPHFRVLREDVFFQESKARTCRICGQKGHLADACLGEAKQKDGDFDEKDKALALKPFIWLHVSILREYLEAELYVPQQPFRFDLERALDDWVFMCFFVGNDFLPHLPSLDIRENGIDTLIAIWRDNIPLMGGYVTKDGHVDLERAQFILDGLAKQEDAIFRRRRQTEERRDANAKRRKLDEQSRSNNRSSSSANSAGPNTRRKSPDYTTPTHHGTPRAKPVNPTVAPPDLPLFIPSKGHISREEKAMTHDMVVNRNSVYKANIANKSAAATLKSRLLNGGRGSEVPGSSTDKAQDTVGQVEPSENVEAEKTPLSALGKRKAEFIDDDDSSTPGRSSPNPSKTNGDIDEPPPDNIRLWEEGYADRYYEQKFSVDPKDVGFRSQVAKAYVEGLAWVLLYYFQGCPSWTWYYPYHYAPFATDFVDLNRMSIKFEKGKPFKPFEQLMGVLPAASNHAIPEVFRSLMNDEDSDIIDFYPEEFPIDLNGKKFAWQGVALLPWIDEKRLLSAMATRYPLLSAEDAARNEMGKDVLIMSDRHPLYEDVATNFYSKRQGLPVFKINPQVSGGLAGSVEKNEDYLPQSALTFPLDDGGMPNLDEDHSIRYVLIELLDDLLSNDDASVHYEMPRSTYIHKSMLLAGIKFALPALDRADIEATKARANRSGRSYGGVPLRGDQGNGRSRGGQTQFADPRPNPFAAHVNPGFLPQVVPGNYRGGPPPPPAGWGPPPPGSEDFRRGPPPPPSSYGGLPHGYPPLPQNFNYGRPPPPSPQGYYNGHHDGSYGTQFSSNQYSGPPPDGRYGGYHDRNGR